MADLKADALRYHEQPTPGKIEVIPSKSCQTAADLSLAYTPGVAQPVLEIEKDPENAYKLYQQRKSCCGCLKWNSDSRSR